MSRPVGVNVFKPRAQARGVSPFAITTNATPPYAGWISANARLLTTLVDTNHCIPTTRHVNYASGRMLALGFPFVYFRPNFN